MRQILKLFFIDSNTAIKPVYIMSNLDDRKFPLTGYIMVGASRFERPTSCTPSKCANQAALRPGPP
jgi:hypothetical protein